MSLLILADEFPPGPGGLGTLAWQVALQLAGQGWPVSVAAPQPHAAPGERARFNASLTFELLPLRRREPPLAEGLDRLARVLDLARRRRPQAILAVGGRAAWLGAALARLAGLPLALVAAGTELLPRTALERALTPWAFRRAKRVVAVSRYAAGLAEGLGVAASRLRIIPCGADPRAFRPGLETAPLRRRWSLEGASMILTVGRLCYRKGQQVVLQAMPAILARCPQAMYLMAGLPQEQAGLEREARRLGVEERVIFAGAVSPADLSAYYNLAEAFVLASRASPAGEVEGFGIAVLEAALCGRPAVVSDHGGLPETILPGQTGLLVPAEDPPATAQALLSLLEDATLRRKMGAAARDHALECATWERRAREYEQALLEMA